MCVYNTHACTSDRNQPVSRRRQPCRRARGPMSAILATGSTAAQAGPSCPDTKHTKPARGGCGVAEVLAQNEPLKRASLVRGGGVTNTKKTRAASQRRMRYRWSATLTTAVAIIGTKIIIAVPGATRAARESVVGVCGMPAGESGHILASGSTLPHLRYHKRQHRCTCKP